MIAAHFFDGHDARLQPVGLDVRNDHLHVDAPGFERSFPLADLRPSSPLQKYSANPNGWLRSGPDAAA